MKTLHCAFCGLLLLLITSCGAVPPLSKNANPLNLTLKITHDAGSSFESFCGQIILKNQSDSDLLVNDRLHILPQLAAPNFSEVLLLIYDSLDNPLDKQHGYIDFELPNKDMFVALKPDEQVFKFFCLSTWFLSSDFQQGEKYTIFVIYQNQIEATQTLDGVEVPAWVGSIRSNEETFVISP
jgi:hypothetical protein